MQKFRLNPAWILLACTGWVIFMGPLFTLVNALPEGASFGLAWSAALTMDPWTAIGFAWMVVAGLVFVPALFLCTVAMVVLAVKAPAPRCVEKA